MTLPRIVSKILLLTVIILVATDQVFSNVNVEREDDPLNLKVQDVSTDAITLTWSSPTNLNPIKYKISFDGSKTFIDERGVRMEQKINGSEITLDDEVRSHTIKNLSPFTTYNVNVTAIPADNSFRPPSKIVVTTEMAKPPPILKPNFYDVYNGEEITVVLPTASEEYGPVSHYYLVVVPENRTQADKNPEHFSTDTLIKNKARANPDSPYIAAKFLGKRVPFVFNLGSGEKRNDTGFINYKLQTERRYRIFIRAVIDLPQKHIYTDSPFSEYLSLDMHRKTD